MTQGWVLKQVYQVDMQDVSAKRNSVWREGAIGALDRRSCCCLANGLPCAFRGFRGRRRPEDDSPGGRAGGVAEAE